MSSLESDFGFMWLILYSFVLRSVIVKGTIYYCLSIIFNKNITAFTRYMTAIADNIIYG